MAIMEEDCFPLLAPQYHPSGCHDLGRLKQRWKDQEHLRDQEEQGFFDPDPNCS
jgi:hypothetical protein